MQRSFWIDTDPGVDDALAILLCALDPQIHLLALSVCGGNVGLNHTFRNAHRLRAQLQQDFAIVAGAAQPLLGVAPDAAFVHGGDGFGDAQWPDALGSGESAPGNGESGQGAVDSALHAAQALIEAARSHPQQLEVLALGPLTNLALALKLEPNLPNLVKRLSIMGGAFTQQGNISAFAEFNIAVDPEAAAIVFQGWPGAVVIDWEATVRYAPTIAWTEAQFASGKPHAEFMRKISRKTLQFKHSIAGSAGAEAPWAWADPIAAFAAVHPDRCQFQSAGIETVLHGPARGATLVNPRQDHLQLLTSLDPLEFHQALSACLAV